MSGAPTKPWFSVIGCILLASCAAYHNLPDDWDKEIPGVYEGANGSFREMLRFNTNGTYLHEVFKVDTRLVSEGGKWSVTRGRFEIHLTPEKDFTEFYDSAVGRFDENGRKFIDYYYYPLPDGRHFTNISADVDFRFQLARKERF